MSADSLHLRRRYGRPTRADISFLLNDEEESFSKRQRISPTISNRGGINDDRRQLSECTSVSQNKEFNSPLQHQSTAARSVYPAQSSRNLPQTSSLESEKLSEMKSSPHQQTATALSTPVPSPTSTMVSATPKVSQTAANNVPCDECGVRFCNLEAILRHKRSQHPPGELRPMQVECPTCKLVLKSQQNLNRHAKVHGPGASFKCEDCDACFTTKRSRTIHMRDLHRQTTAQRYVSNVSVMCPFEGCQYASNRKSNVDRHCDNVHLKIRKFICPFCGVRSGTRANLEIHMQMHDKYGKTRSGIAGDETDR